MKQKKSSQIATILLCLGLLVVISCGRDDGSSATDKNCIKTDSKGHCIVCADRYYIDQSSGVCTKVSGTCNTWDLHSGDCLTCYPGFGKPINGACSSTPVQGSSDDHDVD